MVVKVKVLYTPKDFLLLLPLVKCTPSCFPAERLCVTRKSDARHTNIKMLLEAAADVHATNKDDETAFDIAL